MKDSFQKTSAESDGWGSPNAYTSTVSSSRWAGAQTAAMLDICKCSAPTWAPKEGQVVKGHNHMYF